MPNFQKVQTYLSCFASDARGKAFEALCQRFLKSDPSYSSLLKKVWLWNDWPQNWGRDKGIDLIAETHCGRIWAIQTKAYDQNYYITKEDIDTFLSESARKIISFRLLIATTNNIGPNAQEVIAGQEKPISLCLLDKLEESSLDWEAIIHSSTNLAVKKIADPRPHQERALEDILSGLQKLPYGQLYMACGTGKTLVGLWLAERLQSNTTLVLVPSLSLVAQLYEEWARNHSTEFSFYPIFVCSDETVGNKEDDGDRFVEKSSDLGFPVTTNAQILLQELVSVVGRKVIFSTYHSSGIIKEACSLDNSLIFDLAIADEAHRCAGKASSAFATIVDKTAVRTKHKVFMTATPRLFSEHVKKITKDVEYVVVSMDDEETFGPVFHTLPFSQAITQGLLSDYQVVISVMDNKMHQEYADRGRFVSFDNHETDARTLASQLLVAKTIIQYDLKKVITFHNRKKNAQQFVNDLPNALSLLKNNEAPNIAYSDVIFGEMSQTTRRRILNQFKENSDGCVLLGSVKCLSEGVDVPTLDGIAFIDPRGSEVAIVQAVGRVIRKPQNQQKKIGTIVIPIFVDNVTDETVALDQSCFKSVWKVVNALRAHDDILAEELDTIRLELGKRTYKSPPKLSKITIDLPIGIGVDFGNSIFVKIIQHCSQLSLDKSHPEIAAQWHATKNNGLMASHVVAGSHQIVWWKCSVADDHEWPASIKQRALSGNNCPMCRGSIIVLSNSLAYNEPILCKEWHEKNGNLTPFNVHCRSTKKVWWKCLKNVNHYWKTSVCNRVKGSGCPFCSNQRVDKANSLAITHPDLAREWHQIKNGELTPYDVIAGSNKKAWWQCLIAGDHEWQASLRSRIKQKKCTVCLNRIVVKSNCLATLYPDITLEWHVYKNEFTPLQVVPGSTKKAHWICFKKHEWIAAICDRISKRSGCPKCYKKNLP